MRDTPTDVEARFQRQLMSLTPEERLSMACRMFADAKALVLAAIAQEAPASPPEIRCRLFLRLYGEDFSEANREKILAHLRMAQ